MCGIVGVAALTPRIDGGQFTQMRDSMHHRGPDDAGEFWSDDHRVALGHRRLSIIDLSPGGRQPMSDQTGSIWVVFNGEIYNYQALRKDLQAQGQTFRTQSDTEVILEAYRAWGTACLERLNGMFAFAIYDTNTQYLFLARDRAGEKPLFYRYTGDSLSFASELKALMLDPSCLREIDRSALEHYLTYGYVPGNMCILKGFSKLGPAQAMLYSLETGTLRCWDYWRLAEEPDRETSSPEELCDELEELLADSVRMRMVADVPVGVLLSGGLDSSLVTALAARVSPVPVKTFTVSFPGHGGYDEAPFARQIAEHFGTDHHELIAEPASFELLPQLARQYDEPIADSSMVPTYLVSRLIREHATVALGGDGGDELFGGYHHYRWLLQQQRLRAMFPSVARWLLGKAGSLLPVGFKGRNYVRALGATPARSMAEFNVFFDEQSRRRLLTPPINRPPPGVVPEAFKVSLAGRFKTPLLQTLALDFLTYLPEDILVKVDRASMLTSLEVRAPWLDHRIIDFAFTRVPDQLKVSRSENKILPRLLASRLLPSGFDTARKQGFSLPLATWFKGPWGKYMVEVLAEADHELFNKDFVLQLIARQQRGYTNMHRLFSLAIFELWRRHYRVTIPR